MKGMADSLGDLGWPVEEHILVLNVLRGLNNRYDHLRSWITRQEPFPTFLQVCDDLVMELQQGLQVASASVSGSSTSSTALAATPPPLPSTPSSLSLLGPPPGPSGGGGGDVVADVVAAGDVVQAVGATRCQHLHGLHPGHPFTTHGQGASPCGRSRLPVVSLARRRPCSLVLPRGFPPRPRGRHPLHLRGLGLPVGTRWPWPTPSAPWP